MAAATRQGRNLLNGFKRIARFDIGLGAQLPEAYRKFWREWKEQKPAAVHYIPKEGQFERDEVTGEVRPVQNIPIPLIFPPESNDGIWGGEGVIKGFQKRHPQQRRVPHFWVPVLRRSVIYSAVLDQYMSITITDRTLNLIHESLGFDHYLLKTPACDLKSTLALNIKRKILQSLQNGCPELIAEPEKQKKILSEYGQYLGQYTPEEIEWYGLTYQEAIKKLQAIIKSENPIVPHKVEFRSKLLEQLRKANTKESGTELSSEETTENLTPTTMQETSWLSKMNPFGKKQET